MNENNLSRFDGDVGGWVGTAIIAWLLTLFTLGIGTPWAICMYLRWYYNNSTIQGKRLKFIGEGGSLFGNWIKWFLLCIITLGIYGFWVVPNVCKWVNKNVVFQD